MNVTSTRSTAPTTCWSASELATMYIGSQKLLLHLDIEVSRSTTAKELGEIVEVLKERIKEKVPIVSIIQIEVAPASVPEA